MDLYCNAMCILYGLYILLRVSHEFCIIEIAVAIVWNDEKSTGISGIGAILGVNAGAFSSCSSCMR